MEALSKGGKMKYALTVALMLSFCFGLITESFRYQSTAFLWEDDYDLLFDPARIPEISGARLWTGLSNFVSGDEEIFNEYNLPFFYIGGSGYKGTMFGALVYNRSLINEALSTGLYGPEEEMLYGDGAVTNTSWTLDPTNGDTLAENTTTQTASAYDKANTGDVYIGLAKKADDWRFGLGYMRQDSTRTITDPYENFTTDEFYRDYEEDTIGYLASDTSMGDHVFKTKYQDFIFSAWLDRDNYAVGFQGVYGMTDMGEDAVINCDYVQYDSYTSPNTDYMTNTCIDSIMTKQGGTNIALDLKLFYNYNDDAEGRYYFGYFTNSQEYDDGAMEWFYDASYQDVGGDEEYYDTMTTVTYWEGGTSRSGFRIGTDHLWDINEMFKFGLGIAFVLGSVSGDDMIKTSAYRNVDATYYDDTLFGRTTVTSGDAWLFTTDGSYKRITVPVGVEFSTFRNKLDLRLGAKHNIQYNDVTTTTELYSYDFPTTYIEYGDGTDTTIVDYTPIDDDYWEETDNSTMSHTDFYYGIGWHVNDNFTIDLMNFADLDEMHEWRLSATLKFD